MIPSTSLPTEIIKENNGPALSQIFQEVSNVVPTREEELHEQETKPFQQNIYDLVKKQFASITSEYKSDLTQTRLIEALKKLSKLATDIPSYISFSHFDLEEKGELMDILRRVDEIRQLFEKKLASTKKYEQTVETKLIESWQWNSYAANDLFLETRSSADECFKRYDFVNAEEHYNDTLLLIHYMLQYSANFSPELQQEEGRIQGLLQMTRNNKIIQQKQPNQPVKLENPIKKALEEINKCSQMGLPSFQPSETFLSRLLVFTPNQNSFQDPEFSTPNHLFYSQIKLKRYLLSELRRMDASQLKPSLLNKQLKKKSALLASLNAILYKEKANAFKNVFYPCMPISRTPLYNPYGKYTVRLFINGEYKAVHIDDYLIYSSTGQNSETDFHNEMDFYFSILNKAFQKLKHLGIKIDKDPSIYNWMIMGPTWVPEKILFTPMASKFHYYWEVITKATQSGTLIARKKPSKNDPFAKRIYYNVHTVLDLGNYRLMVMQNLSLADGNSVPDNLRLQASDFGNNQQFFDKISSSFKDEITSDNGMFLTNYQKFLENFDHGYINWRVTTPLKPGYEPALFNNCYALHRKDNFVVSSDFRFVSLTPNPQFKIKIQENYEDTIIWILLQRHTATPDYQKQLAYNVYPKRFSKASVLSAKSSIIQKNFKKQFGQKFLFGKINLNHTIEGKEVSLILTYHSHSVVDDVPKDATEDVAYSIYFYSLHKLQIEELKEELVHTQTLNYDLKKPISSDMNSLNFLNCPQFSLSPKIDYPKQKFYFQIYITPKIKAPLSFNIYDSSYLKSYQLVYGQYPLYTSTQEFKKFDFLEGDFIVNPPDLTKLNIQVVPMFEQLPQEVPFELTLHSNIKCDFTRIPYDEERFNTYELTGFWNKQNAGGSTQHYKSNPKYVIHTFGDFWLRMQITTPQNPDLQVNASIYSCPFLPNEVPKFEIFSTSKLAASTTKEDVGNGTKRMAFTKDPWRQVSEFTLVPSGNYVLIPAVLEAGIFGKYTVKLFSTSKLAIKEYHVAKE